VPSPDSSNTPGCGGWRRSLFRLFMDMAPIAGQARQIGEWSVVPSTNSRSRCTSIILALGKAEHDALYLVRCSGSTPGSVTFKRSSSVKVVVRACVTVNFNPRIYELPKALQVCVLERNAKRDMGIYSPDSRVEVTTPVNVASPDVSTTNGRVLGSYSGTTLTLIIIISDITGTYNASSSLILKPTNGAAQTDTSVDHASALPPPTR